MDENMTFTLGFLFLLLNMGITIANTVRSRNKDNKAELQDTRKQTAEHVREIDAKESANREFQIKTQMKLDQICSVTGETRADIKAMNSRLHEFDKRLFTNERDVEALDKRVANLEEQFRGQLNGKET